MNREVLDKYKIEFKLEDSLDRTRVIIVSYAIPYFTGYFIQQSPEFFIEEILPEIDKAIDGKPFDEDGGGQYHFLTIGPDMSYFEESPTRRYAIPTTDLKEIIVSYVEWIKTNDLEKFI